MHNEDWLESDEDGSPMTWRPSRRCDDSNNNNSSNNKRSLNISSQGTFRRQSQQSYRIRSRRALRYAVGREYAMRAMENKIKETALRYTSSRTCMLFLAIATLSSCLFYIAGTYLGGKAWVETLETGYGVVFLVDYVLSVAAAPVPLNYALSKGGLADLVSCLPAFGSFAPWMTSLAFVRYLRVGKAIRVMRNHKLLSSVFSNDDVTIKATLLIVKVVGVVMMTSAILYGMERGLKDDGGTESFNEPGWQWHDALYFTIVTLSTVGYGDVLPISDLSRLLMVVVIVFALTYVPLEVGLPDTDSLSPGLPDRRRPPAHCRAAMALHLPSKS